MRKKKVKMKNDNKEKFKVLLFYPNEPMVGVTPSNLALISACLKEAGHDTKLFDCSLYKSIRYESRTDGEEGLELTDQNYTGEKINRAASPLRASKDKKLEEETQDDLRARLGQVKTSPIDEYVQLKENSPYDDFADLVESYKPDLIGITVVDSTIEFAYNFLLQIRGPRPTVVFGGVGATFSYDKILSRGYADYVCAGEGEEALPELCTKLKNGQDTSDIRNFYMLNEDGSIRKNPMRPTVDIDVLPVPDFSIYDDSRFYRPFMGKVVRMAQIDWDRGCPYQCTYCAAPAIMAKNREEKIGVYYRVKDEDKIFEEMHYLIKKYRLNFLYITSETLLIIKKDKFKRLMERYKKEINLPFWCQSRLDSFTDERTALLKDAGCMSVSVGLEHGSEEVRQKLLKKRLTNEKVFDGFNTLAKYGIRVTVNSMMGLPDETREQIFETIEINRKIQKITKGNSNLNIFTFVPFSGTHLRNVCIDKGYVDKEAPIAFSFYKESMLTMPSISKKEIAGLEKTAPLYIQLDKSLWPDIKIAEKDDHEGQEMFEKLMILLKEKRESEEQHVARIEEDHLASPMVNFGGKQDYK
jgi:anaerobic magnesium-protoporphyrin IX monomethyl ester cyclase